MPCFPCVGDPGGASGGGGLSGGSEGVSLIAARTMPDKAPQSQIARYCSSLAGGTGLCGLCGVLSSRFTVSVKRF